MKALVIIPSTLRGGVEEYVLRVTSGAVKAGWDVHVALPNAPDVQALINDFQQNGVDYHPLTIAETIYRKKLAWFRRYLPQFIKTIALLKRLQPDVVQIVLPHPENCLGSILACAFLQVPTVVRFGLVASQWSFDSLRLKLYRWARSRHQQWVTISQNNRELVSRSFEMPQQDIVCIYNGASVVVPDRTPQEIEATRNTVLQELGLSPNSILALTVGRLEGQKGYTDLIPAIPHIVKEFPTVQFIWVGDGKDRPKLTNLVKEYGIEANVLFLGYRSDVPKLLEIADLFVFPTHFEGGQSSAIAEAMAYGLPIVTSNASGIPEVIDHGVHGLLFRTGDSCDLLETLRWTLRHPEQMQQMAHNAQVRSHDFSEAKMVQNMLDLWHKMSDRSTEAI
ncbi:glycosyltransferase family 4 protein [Oculatella sp. LEGE 06141]|uniref:glycosyltransferase family 4 protein n=1 Tax=Oculatella sp. LEGE 06141 TaxID=1828648 RepID=UPI00188202CB|nr:glycosyltransferase family 4 protein [Oculatella sp. LEGE 06141]MBE9179993.1 glycosyltransferase family 4 protein [Oculatella sp. LEGE 06141]